MTLTEFLLARIAEDEAAARAAGGDSWEQGERRHERNVVRPRGDFDWIGVSGDHLDVPVLTAQVSNTPRELFEARAAHIARHDPARVLAQCAALRRIVFSVGIATADASDPDSSTDAWNLTKLGDATLRALASIYADHPDFDPQWRLT